MSRMRRCRAIQRPYAPRWPRKACGSTGARNAIFANYLSGGARQTARHDVFKTGWHDVGGQCGFRPAGNHHRPARRRKPSFSTARRMVPMRRADRCKIGKRASAGSPAAMPCRSWPYRRRWPDRCLHLAGQEGGGVNFFGQSSRGKTTLLQIAASVWGRGASPGYVRAWRATANGLEGAAASANDTALVLDELGQVEAREAAAALYSLSNGGGKVRAGARRRIARAEKLARHDALDGRTSG